MCYTAQIFYLVLLRGQCADYHKHYEFNELMQWSLWWYSFHPLHRSGRCKIAVSFLPECFRSCQILSSCQISNLHLAVWRVQNCFQTLGVPGFNRDAFQIQSFEDFSELFRVRMICSQLCQTTSFGWNGWWMFQRIHRPVHNEGY